MVEIGRPNEKDEGLLSTYMSTPKNIRSTRSYAQQSTPFVARATEVSRPACKPMTAAEVLDLTAAEQG